MTSEKVKTRFVKGHPMREWHKPPGVRNETLDRRVYSLLCSIRAPVPWEILVRSAPTEPPKSKDESPASAPAAVPKPPPTTTTTTTGRQKDEV